MQVPEHHKPQHLQASWVLGLLMLQHLLTLRALEHLQVWHLRALLALECHRHCQGQTLPLQGWLSLPMTESVGEPHHPISSEPVLEPHLESQALEPHPLPQTNLEWLLSVLALLLLPPLPLEWPWLLLSLFSLHLRIGLGPPYHLLFQTNSIPCLPRPIL